ncbi:MAG: Ku protein [Gemmatimonadaceae bacterium]|nr:Ku protein [Gemmatimonadaceae bacterium]
MAAIWKGAVTFGLVNIPVEVKTAVRDDHISFRMLHEPDMSPIKYERLCQEEGEPVPWNEIVKGYEYEKGKFVVVTDDDFKAAAVESSRTLDIIDFVKQEEIDPRFFETPYFLVPAKGGEKAYALLRAAMKNADAVGIGKIIMRTKQHLAGIKVVGDALVMEIMRFSSELVDPAEYTFPEADNVRPQELQMAEMLVANLTEQFSPDKYTDDYREKLMKVIRDKMKGKKIKYEEPEEEEDTGVLDLMSRLRESLDQGGRRKSNRTVSKAGRDEAKPAGKKGVRPRKRKSA